ncbi:MAG: AEC family transporter [Candidatus Cloacimonetes bacterium]|nr:AEC family transporter [Candidatus Cloacimonadota bacterium]
MLINKLLPILVFFAAGYGLKRGGVFKKQDGALFLRAVLYLCIPAVGFATFSRMEMGIERLYPVITAFFVIFGNFFLTRMYFKKLGIPPRQYTVYMLATIVLNTSLMLPFAQAKWGDEGAGMVLLFDICHVTLVFTFTYWVAMRYGNERGGKVPFSKILRLPPLWGIFIGLAVNLLKVPVPAFIYEITEIATKGLILLMMTALGIFYELKIRHWRLVAGALLQRSLGGFLLGWLITWILGVQGVERQIILLISAAPVGFNTLVLSDLEDLDRDLAAEMVTSATLIAVIVLPIVLLII